jgi:HEAT repeat protein
VIEVPLAASGLQPHLDTLRDASQPVESRLEALQTVQAASFAIPDFDSVRPEYIAALRQAAEDQDPELRQRALGILAREHDAFAQDVLLEGLRDSDKALVEPDKALQLLSYDPHAGVYPIARDIMQTSDDESTRREALRVLAGDPASAPLLESVLTDKNEPADIRRMSASALHALDPDRLQRWANKAVLDTAEDPEIVATSLTALTQFGDADAISGNKPLLKRVDQLQARAPAKIKKLAKRFAQKYDSES